jgi:dipeptidase E
VSLFLTSAAFDGLDAWLEARNARGPVVVITSASRALDDRDAIIAGALGALAAANRQALPLEVATDDLAPLAAIAAASDRGAGGAIVMTGGDPFALLGALKGSGAAALIRDAHRRGVPIAGQSAGALVCGPTLEPARLTSPFPAPPGLDLGGLQLTPRLVLPHHDRPGRAARHREAALQFHGRARLTALCDDEILVENTVDWRLNRGPCLTRVAVAADAAAVADTFHAAIRSAWAPFLGEARLGGVVPRAAAQNWATRIERGGAGFLVTEDTAGICAFVLYRCAQDSDLEPAAGEIDLLFAHPRVWGDGTARRLLEHATWDLLCQGHTEAVLWTEERNARALAVYRASGWRPDGAVRTQDYLGVPIRNLRHRLDLTRYAGGR